MNNDYVERQVYPPVFCAQRDSDDSVERYIEANTMGKQLCYFFLCIVIQRYNVSIGWLGYALQKRGSKHILGFLNTYYGDRMFIPDEFLSILG